MTRAPPDRLRPCKAIRTLRRERGISIPEMIKELEKTGLTFIHEYGMDWPLERGYYGRLERVFALEQWPEGMKEIGQQMASFVRKSLTNRQIAARGESS